MNSVTIKDIKMHIVALPLVELLKTSYGAEPFKTALLIEVLTEDNLTGWGEGAIKTKPSYSAETVLTAFHVTRDFLISQLIGKTISTPTEVPALLKSVRGNHIARFAVEAS